MTQWTLPEGLFLIKFGYQNLTKIKIRLQGKRCLLLVGFDACFSAGISESKGLGRAQTEYLNGNRFWELILQSIILFSYFIISVESLFVSRPENRIICQWVRNCDYEKQRRWKRNFWLSSSGGSTSALRCYNFSRLLLFSIILTKIKCLLGF